MSKFCPSRFSESYFDEASITVFSSRKYLRVVKLEWSSFTSSKASIACNYSFVSVTKLAFKCVKELFFRQKDYEISVPNRWSSLNKVCINPSWHRHKGCPAFRGVSIKFSHI